MWRAGTMAGGSPFIEDIPDPSTFDSHLEIPTSGDPNANATLTLILRYKLEFADSKNRVPGVVSEALRSERRSLAFDVCCANNRGPACDLALHQVGKRLLPTFRFVRDLAAKLQQTLAGI